MAKTPTTETAETNYPALERCPSCLGVINLQTGECRCS